MMRGQSTILFLMITLTMLIMLFYSVRTLADVMEATGRGMTAETYLNDLANSIANDLVGAVIFLPHNISMNYSKDLPNEVAGESYIVSYDAPNESVVLRSRSAEVSVFISGIRYEIDIKNNSLRKTGVGVVWINVSR